MDEKIFVLVLFCHQLSFFMKVVTGWGTLSQGGAQPTVLQAATVPTMSNAQCGSILTLYSASQITPRMLCAGR